MQLFYSANIHDGWVVLDEEESRHCSQVLRKGTGDILWIIDGTGNFYEASIIEASKKKVTASIQSTWPDPHPLPVGLHIAMGPTKNINRFEWFLEKATEIGISRITPLITQHSERREIRADRLEKIILTAAKQSGRASFPVLAPIMTLPLFLQQVTGEGGDKFIAYLHENVNTHLQENYHPGQDVCILIGPEGGFAPEEVAQAGRAGFKPVSLGTHRLRTETAGIVACQMIASENLRK